MEIRIRKEKSCKYCDGDKMIQSENGDNLIICPYCEGSGIDK
jgi:DnaJ-class molecular chaperone